MISIELTSISAGLHSGGSIGVGLHSGCSCLGEVCCVFVGNCGWCDVKVWGGVCEDGASEELVDAAGVLCPQGSEL